MLELKNFDVDAQRGFLPAHDPAKTTGHAAFAAVEETAKMLPKWLTTLQFRKHVDTLTTPSIGEIESLTEPELRRAMLSYSYLTHAYVLCEGKPSPRLPAALAVPFHAIATRLGRPPVLSYASYAMDNWVRLGDGPPEIGNIFLQQNFLGGVDEDWFILIHIEIEYRAARALRAIPHIIECVRRDDIQGVIQQLSEVHAAWTSMNATMERMTEFCDPYIYYNRVRPYIHGWKNNPALPNGLVYEGVTAYQNQPQFFRGETGAQSAIVPTVDALFGIDHENDPLRTYLMEMQEYMPPKHRAFIGEVAKLSTLRAFAQTHLSNQALRKAYNDCVIELQRFRTKHLEYAASYIHSQAPKANNATDVGTGGTPFMVYLKKHRDESSKHLL